MAQTEQPQPTPGDRPTSLRVVLYGLLFCLLIVLCGLMLRDRQARRQARPFPNAGPDVTIIQPAQH